ncbi:MAG: hypothetical protein IJX82_00235 [Clostridia bacterium]|nr:hypothetical protein [Clostridia bacterium]
MKSENAKTILLGILAVGISLGLLASVLTAAGMPSSEGTPYDGGAVLSGSASSGDKPLPDQTLLKEKFAAYCMEEGDGVLRLFSRTQWSAAEEKRKAGERFFLTYQEIRYLITDTLELYEDYDTLLLTEERSLPIHKTDILDIIADLASFDLCVEPLQQTLTELSYEKAHKAFEKKQEELRAILLYRLYMQDSGWRFVYYTTGEDGTCRDLRVSAVWDRTSPCMLTLSLDEGSAQSTSEYEEALREDCLRMARGEQPLYPLLQIYMDPLLDGPSLRMTLWDTESAESTELYPAGLLAASRPKPYLGNVVPATREGTALSLWAGQGSYLETLLTEGVWKEGGVDCFWTYSFTLSDGESAEELERYTYHPGCGVIYDEKNRKYLELGGLDKKAVDRMLEIASGAKALYGGTVSLPCGDGGAVILSNSQGRHLISLLSAGIWEPAGEYGSFRTILIGETELVYAREEGVVIDPARGMQLRLCEREKAFFEGLAFLDPGTL